MSLTTLELKHFNLPSNVDRIQITRIANGINEFIYDGIILKNSLLPLTISTTDIVKGKLAFNNLASSTILPNVISEYRKQGYIFDKIDVDHAVFSKEGFRDIRIYIGDTSDNILYYRYSTEGSLVLSEESSLTVRVKSKNHTPKPLDKKDSTLVINTNLSFSFASLFPEAHSIKIVKQNTKYYPNSITGTIIPISEDILFTFNPHTEEVRRIIKCKERQGYVFLTIHNDLIYFLNKKKVIETVSLPNTSLGKILYLVSYDGITFSDVNSRLYLKHEWREIELEEYFPIEIKLPQSEEKELIINDSNVSFIPIGGTEKEIIVND